MRLPSPNRDGFADAPALTITELERATGVPRSTIYYYVREGLLPPAQKAAVSRGIYTEAHVELLADIGQLKMRGLSMAAIKDALADRVAAAGRVEVDLVAQRSEKNRRTILEVAARQFARGGYNRTRIADIMQEVGVSPPVFYSHFRTKRQLFLESFTVYLEWMKQHLEPQIAREPDPLLRFLARVVGYYGLQVLSPDLLSLSLAEALHEGGEMRQVAVGTYDSLTEELRGYLAHLRAESAAPPSFPDELVAYSFLGALEYTALRASWDQEFSRRDVIWSHFALFLAIEAQYTGRTDVAERLEQYRTVIERLAAEAPPMPAPAVP